MILDSIVTYIALHEQPNIRNGSWSWGHCLIPGVMTHTKAYDGTGHSMIVYLYQSTYSL